MDLVNTVDFEKNTLPVLEEYFDTYIKALKATRDRIELKNCIAFEFKTLVKSFIEIGNKISNSSVILEDKHLINYILSEDFKIIMILHRNVFLELCKVAICKQENQLSDNQIINHYQSSKEILENKLLDFIDLIRLEKNKTTNPVYTKKILNVLKHQINPWDIYKSQYEVITNQIKDIDKKKVIIFASIATFENLKQVVTDLIKNHNLLIENILNNANYILKNSKEKKESSNLLSYIDDQLSKQSNIENKHNIFSETIKNHINQLQKIEIPITAVNGLLAVRENDLKKTTQKWFDYEILPEFMDLIGFEASLTNKYNLNLVNLKNSLQLTEESKEGLKHNSIIHTLFHLKEDIKDIKIKCEAISKSLIDKVNKELLLTNLIKGKDFLNVTLNSSLNTERQSIIKKIKDKIIKATSYFNYQYNKSLQYKALSNMELSTQCIAHRMNKNETTHYDSLFLNKKFIGDLFLVERKTQENKLKLIVDQWNIGFSKSVLVTGDRLSGRSTFLDYSAKKIFKKNIIILKPNSDAIIDGRKFKTTYNLKTALVYIKNNSAAGTKSIITIDDLEMWRDKKYSILYNIRALINFIETESDNTFVMVSVTKMMANHLDCRMNFSNSFSHIINTNEADENEIVDAILLRHGASHRNLINESLEPISNSKARILAHKLTKKNHFNFGNALQSWTYHTIVQDNEKVMFKDFYYEFLDFFTAQEVIILKQALIFMNISEYGIKNVTTIAFEAEFKSALRRLMNVKVLLRNIEGELYINPVVVNDITKIIINKTNK